MGKTQGVREKKAWMGTWSLVAHGSGNVTWRT